MTTGGPPSDLPEGFLADVLDAWGGIAYVYDLEHQRNLYINATWGRQFGYALEDTGVDPDKVLATIVHPTTWRSSRPTTPGCATSRTTRPAWWSTGCGALMASSCG